MFFYTTNIIRTATAMADAINICYIFDFENPYFCEKI